MYNYIIIGLKPGATVHVHVLYIHVHALYVHVYNQELVEHSTQLQCILSSHQYTSTVCTCIQ